MPFNSTQITLSSANPKPLVLASTFTNVTGANGDELPLVIGNTDAAITMYLGGPTVSAATGYPLVAGASLALTCMGTDATGLYAIAASGTPVIAVLVGRQ